MNWMIDGVYGDLYRRAQNLPLLEAARDEWETECRIAPRDGMRLSQLLAFARLHCLRTGSSKPAHLRLPEGSLP